MQTDSEDNDVSSITFKSLNDGSSGEKKYFCIHHMHCSRVKNRVNIYKKGKKKIFALWRVLPPLKFFRFDIPSVGRDIEKWRMKEKKKKKKGKKQRKGQNFEISPFRLLREAEGDDFWRRHFHLRNAGFLSLSSVVSSSPKLSRKRRFVREIVQPVTNNLVSLSILLLVAWASNRLWYWTLEPTYYPGEFNCALSASHAGGTRLSTSGKSLKDARVVRTWDRKRKKKVTNFRTCAFPPKRKGTGNN